MPRILSGMSSRAAVGLATRTSYSATKAGIDAFAETLRKEISDDRNIKVTVIQPGSAGTDMQECTEDEIESDLKKIFNIV